MNIDKHERRLAEAEGGQVRRAVESIEAKWVALQADRVVVRRRECDLPDFLQSLQLAPVVEERHPLVVAGRVGHQDAIRARQLLVDVEQLAEVLAHLLHGHDIEPTDDLGQQVPVLRAALLGAEVGDVPGGDEQLVLGAAGNAALFLWAFRSNRSAPTS